MDMSGIRAKLEARTLANPETNCWEYLGINANGYGQIIIDGQFYYTHILSARIFFGYIPSIGLEICHKCSSKACWNPEHIYIGDGKTNQEDRAETITRCKWGHEFTPANTYIATNGKYLKRQCRKCKAIRQSNRYHGIVRAAS